MCSTSSLSAASRTSSTPRSTSSAGPRRRTSVRPPPAGDSRSTALGDAGLPHEHVRFAHNSERQFAKLLDFYGISWQYEPTTFVLEWDRQGNPVQAFCPDFYLPAYDLYIEITTLNQRLVTKKNRKLRRLLELHPNVNVKMLYQRDYLALLVKYGLEEPSQLADAGLDEVEPLPLPLDIDVASDGRGGAPGFPGRPGHEVSGSP